ncbi:MAG: autotransporter domain-containing protein [Candidatus Wallbacteria bacterium]|nr:autotransporter domain-containing protein [Candidatus Wallbacteria bacterium]
MSIGDLSGAGRLSLGSNTLTINQAADSIFSGDIADGGIGGGTGASLIKRGAGTLTLAGNSTYTGTTDVLEGELNVTGTLQTDDVRVAPGATVNMVAGSVTNSETFTAEGNLTLPDDATLLYRTLTGDGTIDTAGGKFTNRDGAVTMGTLTFTGDFVNNGTLAPGNSPGLTTIGGNYTESGTLEAELETTTPTPTSGHDQVRVGGTVTVNPTANLVVQTFNNVQPARGNIYQVIASATGTEKPVSGAFGSVRFDADGAAGAGAAVVNAATVFDQATGQLVATGLNGSTSTFADLGATPNQRRAATAVFDHATSFVGQNQINTAAAPGFLARQLVIAHGNSPLNLARFTPQFYGAMADYTFTNDLGVTNLLHDRVSALSVPRSDVDSDTWSFFSGWMRRRADAADLADINSVDFYFGADRAVSDDLTIGLLVTDNNGDVRSTFGRADIRGTGVDAYMRKRLGSRLDLAARIGFGGYDYNTNRSTTDVTAALGKTESDSFNASIGVAYRQEIGKLKLAPRADLTYSDATVRGFSESGANDRLTLGQYDADRLVAQVGASLGWPADAGSGKLSFELTGGLAQSLVNDKTNQQATVVTAPGASFTQVFADEDETAGFLGANVGYKLSDDATIFAGYEERSNSDGNASAGLRLTF